MLSVYRDYGVVPRESRDDNHNKPGDDLDAYRVVRSGDLVLNKMKTWQGSLGISDYEGIVSPAYFVASPLTADHPRFVHHLLRSAPLVAEYRVRSKGIRPSQWDLPWDEFREIKIELPPVSTQRAIADYLDREIARISALIETKARMAALLREKLVASRRASLARGMAAKGIPLRRLVSCLDGQRVPLNAEERALRPGPYPYWGAGSIVDHLDSYLFDEELVLLGEDGAPFFDSSRDVAFRAQGRIWVNNHIHVLRCRAGVDARWLRHMLNAVDFSAYISGSTRDKLTQEEMMEIRLPQTAFADQLVAREELDEVESLTTAIAEKIGEQLDLLKEHRVALIAAAVTGQLEIPEAA